MVSFCLQDAIVSSVPQILVNGTNALWNSYITSNLYGIGSQQLFEIEIYDGNSHGFYLNCSLNDVCSIGCYHTMACTNMNLSCYGICFVECGYDGYDCPVLEYGNYTLGGMFCFFLRNLVHAQY